MSVLRVTDRQQQILDLAARGQSDKEIALGLGISVHTVRSHLQRLYRAQGLVNRAEAVAAWAGRESPATPEPVVIPPEETAEQDERLSRVAELTAAAQIPVQTAAAETQLELINRERLGAGLIALEWDRGLAAIAKASARRMAEQGHLATIINEPEESKCRQLRAENVGYWSGINDVQLHALFVADPKQRSNILGPHQLVGAAWANTGAGVAFLSVLFA